MAAWRASAGSDGRGLGGGSVFGGGAAEPPAKRLRADNGDNGGVNGDGSDGGGGCGEVAERGFALLAQGLTALREAQSLASSSAAPGPMAAGAAVGAELRVRLERHVLEAQRML